MLIPEFSKQVTLKDNSVVTLRFPNPNDIQNILDLVNELVEEDTFFLVTEKMTYEQEKEFLAPVFKDIEKGRSFFLYAFDGETCLGWVNASEVSPRSTHVRELGIALKKEYRGKGLGKTLMEEAMNLVKTELGCSLVILTVGEENQPGVGLYRKLGFVEAGFIPNAVKFYGKVMGQFTFYKEL
jgi:ribosomal protein S18 acetylase RimI-like enzyme